MTISVFLADDNLIVREGVKALLELEEDFEIVGQGADYEELVNGAEAANPQVKKQRDHSQTMPRRR
jgi:DNA-binding NarL/FixJ family response regulator